MTEDNVKEKKGSSADRPKLSDADIRAIEHLKKSVARGKHWYLALLEAIKIWSSPEEYYQGRHLKYLIDGEAFDWLLLAERLCAEIDDVIPENEKIDLLFYDKPPVDLPKEEFKRLIGASKYKAYLNYAYGVLVEEALIAATVQDIRKEKRSQGTMNDSGILDRAYKLIYGNEEEKLLRGFMRDKGYGRRKTMSLGDIKEFYYWLFKYRLKNNDKSRVASDTKKALIYLQQMMAQKRANI